MMKTDLSTWSPCVNAHEASTLRYLSHTDFSVIVYHCLNAAALWYLSDSVY